MYYNAMREFSIIANPAMSDNSFVKEDSYIKLTECDSLFCIRMQYFPWHVLRMVRHASIIVYLYARV